MTSLYDDFPEYRLPPLRPHSDGLLDIRSVWEIGDAAGDGGGKLAGGDHLGRVAQPRTELNRF